MRRAILIALATALASPAIAQESFPGSVFTVPDTDGQAYVALEDQEVSTDLDIFLKRGYLVPDWRVHEAFVEEAAAETVVPDYVQRTGQEPGPVAGRVEIASAMLTHPDFKDMLAVSRLPGDCDEMGCEFQVWTLEGERWNKVFQFKALAAAYKDGDEDGTHWMAAVGDTISPSRLYFWNGKEYVQQ